MTSPDSPIRRPLVLFLCLALVFLPLGSCGTPDASPTRDEEADAPPPDPVPLADLPPPPAGSLASTPPPRTPLPESPVPPADELRRRLDRSMELIRELRTHLDRSQFELDALVDSLDYEAESIVRFVEGEIAFEAYPGLLRGAKGTLFSRAGNALDQSVLLATLLRDAGYDARIVRGRLSAEDASALLETLFAPRPPQPAVGDRDAIFETLGRAARFAELDEATARELVDRAFETPDIRGSALHQAAERDAGAIRRLLDEAGIATGGTEELGEELVRDARDYFWVEHRLGPSDPWTPSHPATGGDAPATEERVEVLAGEVPASFQHRLRVEVEIEQLLGSRLRRRAVMKPWERPVANMVGVQLSYYNHPDSLETFDQLDDPAAIAESTTFFQPIFDGALAEGAQIFDLDGVTLPPSAVGADSFGAAGVIREVGGKMESAAEGLAGMGRPQGEPAPEMRALTGQWLVYTLVSPGGEERQIRRTILDRLGPARDEPGPVSEADLGERSAAVWALAGEETFMVAPGEIPDAYALDRLLRKALDLRVVWSARIDALAADDGDEEEAGVTMELLEAIRSEPEVGLLRAFSAADPVAENVVSYRRAPSVVARRIEIVPTGREDARVRSLVDVVASGEQALRRGSAGLVLAVGESIRIGSWITHAEAGLPTDLVARPPVRRPVRRGGAADLFSRARSSGVELRVLAPGDVRRIADLALPWRTRQEIRGALEDGYAVIAPQRVESDVEATWWRIDPATGSTLGLGPDGRGVAMSEYIIKLNLLALGFSIGFGVASFVLCVSQSECGSRECLGSAGLGAVISYFFATALGALVFGLFLAPVTAALEGVAVGAAAEVLATEALTIALLAGDLTFAAVTIGALEYCLKDQY